MAKIIGTCKCALPDNIDGNCDELYKFHSRTICSVCSAADTDLKQLDRVVGGASFLSGVCLSVTWHIIDLCQY